MLQYKPYLTLELDISGCEYDIEVNGVSVLDDFTGRPVKVELPVNHWMSSGKNNLNILLYFLEDDPSGKNAEMSATLKIRTAGTQAPEFPITRLVFRGKTQEAESSPPGIINSQKGFTLTGQGDVEVSEVTVAGIEDGAGVAVSRSVTMNVNIPRWAFLESPLITNKGVEEMSDEEYDSFISTMLTELFPLYKKIHEALRSGNVDAILPLFVERNGELEQAFYHSPGKISQDLADSLKKSVSDPGKKLLELSPKQVGVLLYPNRRLIRLERDSGAAAILFNSADGSGHEGYHITLRRHGNSWVITR